MEIDYLSETKRKKKSSDVDEFNLSDLEDEDVESSSIDPFSTKQFQSKRRRGFRKKPRTFSEQDIEALQQLSCAKAFAKFHSKIKREAENDESIGDYLKACALLATKLRHCKNEFIENDQSEEQIENYYKERLEEYAILSKQEFLTLAERYKSDIHHTIEKWLKKRSSSRSHGKKTSSAEFKRNMLSDALQALANKWCLRLRYRLTRRTNETMFLSILDECSSRNVDKLRQTMGNELTKITSTAYHCSHSKTNFVEKSLSDSSSRSFSSSDQRATVDRRTCSRLFVCFFLKSAVWISNLE